MEAMIGVYIVAFCLILMSIPELIKIHKSKHKKK